ncbi:MAG: hypothetical protein ACLQVI_42420 [Polyangiaceae bacterium]|jgi:hypothetical protein
MTRSRILTGLVPLSLLSLAAIACSATPSGSSTGTTSAAQGGGSSPGGSGQNAQGGGGGINLGNDVTGAPGGGTCVPAAPATFADAICVCEGLGEAGVLRTHSTAPGAASVGVNEQVAAATGSDIEGSLVAYNGLSVAGSLNVRDAVSSTLNVNGAGTLDVGGDLSVGGAFDFVGALQVGGALRLAQPATLVPGAQPATTAPYVAPSGPPCACDPSSLLPIASLVTAAASTNDNAAIGLGTTGADLLGVGNLTLPTGNYYFSNVTRVGAGKITIDGAVALYIDGSIDQVGDQQITLNAGATLDLYVSGVIASAGSVALGDPTNPGAFRLFLGGAGAVMATAGAQLWNGLVYAPQADVAFAGVTKLNGALFAKSLTWAGVLDVTYDGISGSTSCTPSDAPDASSTSSPTAPSAPTPH